MRFTTDGLIVREKSIGEQDRLVVALTRQRGLVTAFAVSAKRMKAKNPSATAMLAYSRLTVFEGRDTYRIHDAEPIDIFFELRLDIERLALAQYFCELMLHFAPKEEEAGEYLRLILAAFHYLRQESRPRELIKAVFELRLMCLSGYMPDLSGCRACGDELARPMYLDRLQGRLMCPVCTGQQGGAGLYPLSAGVLAAMRHILTVPLERLFSFSLPPEELNRLAAVCEDYLLVKGEGSYQTLGFYKSIQNPVIEQQNPRQS